MKKEAGIARELDQLGRVVIPIAIRKRLNLHPRDLTLITVDDSGNSITLTKYNTKTCVFCGEFNPNKLTEHLGRHICDKCREELP
jgi:transcriptional pleiotropic regulator of transition state genes